eukprot:m.10380 g.10380  ORF g.10380 m.10380 type:complete len:322 (+) comp6584_c0_seq1:215-1180(+)
MEDNNNNKRTFRKRPPIDVDEFMTANDDDILSPDFISKSFQLHQLQQMQQGQQNHPAFKKKILEMEEDQNQSECKKKNNQPVKLNTVLDKVLGPGDDCTQEPHEEDDDYLLPTVDCKPLQKWSGPEANSLIHLYRGEMGRMTLYRVRLDASTNWAVTTTSVLTVLALGTEEVPHFFFVFILYMNTVFLIIEARRFYLVKQSNKRVNCIEKGFFAGIVLPQAGYDHSQDTLNRVHQEWRIDLHNLLVNPKKRYLAWAAFYNRFSRNYIYMYLATYVGWLFKLASEDDYPWEIAVGIGCAMLFIALVLRCFAPLPLPGDVAAE